MHIHKDLSIQQLWTIEFDVVHHAGELIQHAYALSVAGVGVNSSISMSALLAAQLSDPVLSAVHSHLQRYKCPLIQPSGTSFL